MWLLDSYTSGSCHVGTGQHCAQEGRVEPWCISQEPPCPLAAGLFFVRISQVKWSSENSHLNSRNTRDWFTVKRVFKMFHFLKMTFYKHILLKCWHAIQIYFELSLGEPWALAVCSLPASLWALTQLTITALSLGELPSAWNVYCQAKNGKATYSFQLT